MKIQMRENKGITLIALVITIIILLILAGITIASLTGDNGLIGKSGEAKNATEKSQEKEELEVAVLRFTDKRGNLDATKIVNGLQKDIKNLKEVTNTDGNFPVKVEYKNGHKYGITREGDILENIIDAGETAPDDSNAVYISDKYLAVIPAGFTVSGTPGETSIENGLVIRDSNQNEWVWIPVSNTDLNKMYVEDSTGWNLLGTSGETAVTTKLRTRELTTQNTFKLGNRELPRIVPGNISSPYYREPDLITGDSSQYDNVEQNWKDAGFENYIDMAIKLKDDYKDMMDSVKENKGFYIGRYEIGKDSSNSPQEKAGAVMTYTNWYNLYFACKKFSSENVESRMIWGSQWDQVCRFINEHGNKVSLDDSRTYGNYRDSEGAAATNRGSFNNTTGSRNSAWKANNIYDLAGNCWEWTQEACGTNNRAFRGRYLH